MECAPRYPRRMMRSRRAGHRSTRFAVVALVALTVIAGCAPIAGDASAARQTPPPGAEDGAEASSAPRSADGARAADVPVKRTGAPPPIDAETRFVDDTLAGWTLEQTVASLVMIAHPGTDPAPARAVLDAHGFGGFIVMGTNATGSLDATAGFVSGLSADPLLPVLTAVDQEGGDVRRLPGDAGPAGRDLHGADPAAVEDAFASRAAIVDAAGVAVNFGVVADVTADPAAFIHRRVLDTAPSSAADRVAAAVRGEQGTALSTLKHFPGHGASPDDSHVSIPGSSIELTEWRRTHALPFAAGIDAGAELVMTGHLRFDRVSPHPASLSPTWMRILRDDLDFDGVIVTDDLLMLQRSGIPEFADPHENAVRALAAGNDVLLFVLPADPAQAGVDPARLVARLAEAVRSGEVSEEQVERSARRVLELRRVQSEVAAPSCGPACDRESVRAHWRDRGREAVDG